MNFCKVVDCYYEPYEDGFCLEHSDAEHGYWVCPFCKHHVPDIGDTKGQCSCGELREGYVLCKQCENAFPANGLNAKEGICPGCCDNQQAIEGLKVFNTALKDHFEISPKD